MPAKVKGNDSILTMGGKNVTGQNLGTVGLSVNQIYKILYEKLSTRKDEQNPHLARPLKRGLKFGGVQASQC